MGNLAIPIAETNNEILGLRVWAGDVAQAVYAPLISFGELAASGRSLAESSAAARNSCLGYQIALPKSLLREESIDSKLP